MDRSRRKRVAFIDTKESTCTELIVTTVRRRAHGDTKADKSETVQHIHVYFMAGSGVCANSSHYRRWEACIGADLVQVRVAARVWGGRWSVSHLVRQAGRWRVSLRCYTARFDDTLTDTDRQTDSWKFNILLLWGGPERERELSKEEIKNCFIQFSLKFKLHWNVS